MLEFASWSLVLLAQTPYIRLLDVGRELGLSFYHLLTYNTGTHDPRPTIRDHQRHGIVDIAIYQQTTLRKVCFSIL
jgi:hypothetical protein